jgi:signal peptidase I
MRRFAVVDTSMEPVLSPGDYLLARTRAPRPGEIVVFEHPGRAGFHLVKRVIAVEGETVEITSGTVHVDGSVRDPAGELLHTAPDGAWVVPDGHCFVLSDARTATTADSRSLGCVPVEGISVARFRYWPVSRVGRPG